MSLPTITCKGRLTKDIELRWTNSGKAVASFDIACSKTHLNKQTNQWEQIGDTLFLHCELWGTPAENLTEAAGKGTEVLITGELQANNWTDKQNNNRRDVKVRVDTIALTPARKQQTPQSQYPGGGWNDPPQSQAFPQDAPF